MKFSTFIRQSQALIWKNVKIIGPISALSLLFLPLIIIVIGEVILSVILSPPQARQSTEIGISTFLKKYPSPVDIKFFYSPAAADPVSIMNNLVAQNSLPLDCIVGANSFDEMLDAGFAEVQKIHDKKSYRYEYFFVHFDQYDLGQGNMSVFLSKVDSHVIKPVSYGYGNSYSSQQGFLFGSEEDTFDFHVFHSINSAIVATAAGKSTPKFKLDLKLNDFRSKSKTANDSPYYYKQDSSPESLTTRLTIRTILNLALGFGNLIYFFRPFLLVVEEKRKGLINLMRQMNLYESVYWLSYLFIFMLYDLISSLVSAAFISGSPYLKEWVTFSFGECFGIIFTTNVLLVCLGLFLGALCRRPIIVNIALGIMTIFTLVFIAIMSFATLYQSSDRSLTTVIPTIALYSKINNYGTMKALSILVPFFSSSKYISNVVEQFQVFDNSTNGVLIKEFVQSLNEETADLSGLPFLGGLILLFLAFYCGQVFGDSDVAFQKPPLFFLNRKRRVSDAYFVEGDTNSAMKLESLNNRSLLIRKLTKSYGSGNTAVKEFSGELRPGQCYVLLGPNGSGKTSLIKMLSGTCSPTSGNAYLMGNSVQDEVEEIYRVSSCCYQDNVLWDSLTACDHFYIFSHFREIDYKDQVGKLLEAVDLTSAKDKAVGKYSGGMKRRMSFILSVFGNPKIIFLDEPTTGLDPVNRRKVWSAVQEVKTDRIVILTTHAMEEADALGDHIFIMNQGKLVASGSSLFLKNHYGVGFQIKILSKDENLLSRIRSLSQKIIKSSEILSQISGELLISIPRSSIRQLILFLKTLQKVEAVLENNERKRSSNTSSSAVMEWSISNTTLEQVFLTVSQTERNIVQEASTGNIKKCVLCKRHPATTVTLFNSRGIKIEIPDLLCLYCCQEIDLEVESAAKKRASENGDDELSALLPEIESTFSDPTSDPSRATESTDAPKKSGKTLASLGKSKQPVFITHMIACLYKNYTYEMKQRKMNLCLIIFTLLLIICQVVFVNIFSTMSTGSSGIQSNSPKVKTHYCLPDDLSSYQQELIPCNRQKFYGQIKSVFQQCPKLICSDLINRYDSGYMDASALYNPFGEVMKVPILWYSEKLESLAIADNFANLLNLTGYPIFFRKSGDAGSQLDAVFDNYDSYFFDKDVGYQANPCSSSYLPTMLPINTSLLPASFPIAEFGAWSIGTDQGVPTLKITANKDLRFYYMVNKTNYIWKDGEYTEGQYLECAFTDLSKYPFQMQLPHAKVMTSFLNSVLKSYGKSGLSKFNILTYKYPTFGVQFPVTGTYADPIQLISISALYVFVSMLLLPRIVDLIVLEKSENIYYLLRVTGLSTIGYWMGHAIFYMSYLFIVNVLIVVVIGVFSWFSIGVDYGPLIIAVFLWCGNIVSIGFFIGAIVDKRQTATFVSYFVAIIMSLLAVVFVILDNVSGVFWIPSVAITRIMSTLINKNPMKGEDVLCFVFLLIDMLVLAAIAVSYVEVAFFYGESIKKVLMSCFSRRKGKIDVERLPDSLNNLESPSLDISDLDVDVLAAVKQIKRGRKSSDEGERKRILDSAVLTDDLFKSYDGKTMLLKDLTMSIERGECFALLGKNGCGKTTLLSILMGLKETSAGDHFIFNQRKPARGVIGVCPQFDALYDDLTVREHLKFFSFLSGMSKAGHNAMIQKAAEQVDLDGDTFVRRAGSLSGGQKRRLSIALAIVGLPRLLILDEPTTGIDPENRHKIWEIIHFLRNIKSSDANESPAGMTILLQVRIFVLVKTTHSMSEAEALASRIGILANSQLRALGTPHHLKKRFGNGYRMDAIMAIGGDSSEKGIEVEINRVIVYLSEVTRVEKTGIRLISKPYLSLFSDTRGGNTGGNSISSGGNSKLYKASFSLHIESKAVDMAVLFEGMNERHAELNILEWAISGANMEDVFLHIVDAAAA